MSRETFLREKILEQGTMKDFAIRIEMPYSTLQSILKNVGGAAVDNIFKICHGLNIPADTLDDMPKQKPFFADEREKTLVHKYRRLDERGKTTVDSTVDQQLAMMPSAEKKNHAS